MSGGPPQHKVWTAPIGKSEDPRCYKQVRLLMVMDIARDKYTYANKTMKQMQEVIITISLANDTQLIRNSGNEVLSDYLKLGIIRLIEEITEPLVTQDLELSGVHAYATAVRRVRDSGRNETSHRVYLAGVIDPAYNTALESMVDISKIFEHHFPTARKALEKQIKLLSGGLEYGHLLATLRTHGGDIASFITLESETSADAIPKGRVRQIKPSPNPSIVMAIKSPNSQRFRVSEPKYYRF